MEMYAVTRFDPRPQLAEALDVIGPRLADVAVGNDADRRPSAVRLVDNDQSPT